MRRSCEGIRAAALGLSLIFLTAGHADAQVLGYGVGGLGGVSGFFNVSPAFQASGGIEALFRGRLGVGAEVGVFGNASSLLYMFSPGVVYHVVPSRIGNRVSPFVTGGRSAFGESDVIFGTWNVGAGVDLWARDRVGVRLEVRDHIRPDPRGNVQYWTIRGGIVFR